MDIFLVILGVASVVTVTWAVGTFRPQSRIVAEYERGVRYRKGHLVGQVGPGRYWLRPRLDELTLVDVRRRQTVIAGQEVLTADRVPIKISLLAELTVTDALKAVTTVDRYEDALYGRIQLALREAVAGLDLDAALAERGELGEAVANLVREGALDFGIELHSVHIRDFMMAGGLRSAYTEVIEAKQHGLAALERARGESAAVRNLANSAQLMERHPGIMQLRLLQAVESSAGNRIVIALDPNRGTSTELVVPEEPLD